jgi:hypothetical protein
MGYLPDQAMTAPDCMNKEINHCFFSSGADYYLIKLRLCQASAIRRAM